MTFTHWFKKMRQFFDFYRRVREFRVGFIFFRLYLKNQDQAIKIFPFNEYNSFRIIRVGFIFIKVQLQKMDPSNSVLYPDIAAIEILPLLEK